MEEAGVTVNEAVLRADLGDAVARECASNRVDVGTAGIVAIVEAILAGEWFKASQAMGTNQLRAQAMLGRARRAAIAEAPDSAPIGLDMAAVVDEARSGMGGDAWQRVVGQEAQAMLGGAREPTPKITGYRALTAEEVSLLNDIKAAAEAVGRLVQRVEDLPADGVDPVLPGHPAADHRWAAVARTQLQLGFMALTRAVARPTTF